MANPFYRETTKYYADVLDGQMQTGKSALGLVWADTGELVHPDSYLDSVGVPCMCETFTDPSPYCAFHGVNGHHVIVDPTPEQLLSNHRRKEHHELDFRHAHLLKDVEMTSIDPEIFERLRGAISTENWGD